MAETLGQGNRLNFHRCASYPDAARRARPLSGAAMDKNSETQTEFRCSILEDNLDKGM
jgi:hypothetical protein